MAKPKDRLEAHAAGRDTIAFSEPILHGKLRFGKGEVVKFPDPRVAAYFDIAFNGTDFSEKKPTRELTADEINFDPEADGETIDPQTVIRGREGVADGTTVLGEAGGSVEVADARTEA